MNEKITALLAYQKADSAVDAAEKEVKSSKERKTALAMKQRYELAMEERKKMIALRDKAVEEFGALYSEAQKLIKLAGVKRNENIPEDTEAIAKLVAEIDKLSNQLKKLEERVSALNASIGEHEKKITDMAEVANKAKDGFEANKQLFEKLLADAKPNIDKLKAVRDKKAAKVDKELLDKYTALKKRKVVPPMAKLSGERCDGCKMSMPSFTISNANKNGYCECENCGRIVYVE